MSPRCDAPDPSDRYMQAAQQLWQSYQRHGPGKVPADLVDQLDTAWRSLEPALEPMAPESRHAFCTLHRLLTKAGVDSAGLSFVTGEAGLIPRPDLVQAVERTLAQLGSV